MVQHFQVQSLLDKSLSDDPDLRFMALTDLMTECAGPSLSLDEPTEVKVMDMVLKLMEDINGEVKNAGVKALSVLSPRLRKNQLTKVIDRLILMASGASAGKGEDLRDVASLALKTVTANITPDSPVAATVIEKLPSQLLAQLEANSLPPQQTLETLDVLSDLFARFPALVTSHPEIQVEALRVLVSLLNSGRVAVKKKAILVLGNLIPSISQKLFANLSKTIVSSLSASSSSETARAYVQLVGTLSRSAPQKTGSMLKDVMPAVLASCEEDREEEDKETALQTLESLVLRCPTEVTPFLSEILALSSGIVSFDPNFAEDDDEEDEQMEDAEEEEEEDDELVDEEYDDDEDSTWKVRRSSAKVLAAIISTRPELLLEFVQTVFPILISRVSEREESVRLEIFAAISLLLRQTIVFGKSAAEVDSEARSRGMSPATLKKLLKQLGGHSLPTQQAGCSLLKDLVAVLRGGLSAQSPVICTRVAESLAASNHANSALLTAETLSFLGSFFAFHPLKVYQSSLDQFVPQIVRLSKDKSQKISSESFGVASELAKAIRSSHHLPLGQGLDPFVHQIFDATVAALQGHLAGVDVRLRGIETLADLLRYEGDVLEAKLPAALSLLTAAVGNDALKLAGLKAVSRVAGSSLCQGSVFEAWLEESLGTVAAALKRGSRSVKGAAFEALETLLSRLGTNISAPIANDLILELEPFLVDTDLHNLPLALSTLTLLLKIQPSITDSITSDVLPKVLALTRSPVLVGAALDSVLAFFAALVEPDPDMASQLVPELVKVAQGKTMPESTSGGAQAYRTSAKCVGEIVGGSQRNSAGVIAEFEKHVQASSKSAEPLIYFSLLSLGEIGRTTDMSSHQPVFERFIELFTAPNEELRNAAAFAAGNFAVGAPQFLTPIVQQVQTATKREIRLLSLHALKEAIFHSSRRQLEAIADPLWKPLFEDFDTSAEETRNVIASCIGKLTTSNPAKYLPRLQTELQSSSANTRATVASAVRYTFTDTEAAYDDILAPVIVEFLSLMHDSDIMVRRLSLGSLNAAAQNKPQLIREHLDKLLPLLYKETEIKTELIRVVQMGPWKQTYDDGLDARKTAYETMYTLLDTCLNKIDIPIYLARVVKGLTDADEIQVICFLSLARLAQVAPAAVTQILDEIAPNFLETMKAFVGGKDTVKQDFDRKAEIQRSALRTIYALSKLSSTATPRFEELVATTRRGEFAKEWSELDR